jgi:hypothetical protein
MPTSQIQRILYWIYGWNTLLKQYQKFPFDVMLSDFLKIVLCQCLSWLEFVILSILIMKDTYYIPVCHWQFYSTCAMLCFHIPAFLYGKDLHRYKIMSMYRQNSVVCHHASLANQDVLQMRRGCRTLLYSNCIRFFAANSVVEFLDYCRSNKVSTKHQPRAGIVQLV